MNTDLAKKWNEKQFPTDYCTAEKDAVLAFARYLDEREEAELKAMVQPVHREPRKEDKPVCLACQYNERNGNDDAKVHTCKPVCEHGEKIDGVRLWCANCIPSQPKPKPIAPPLGWMCPVCHACYAILVSKCENSHMKVVASSSTS